MDGDAPPKPTAPAPPARPRGLLLRRPLHGLYRRVPAEARNMLRIRLPPLPLSRHAKRIEIRPPDCAQISSWTNPSSAASTFLLRGLRLARHHFIFRVCREPAQLHLRSQAFQRRPVLLLFQPRLLQDEQHHPRKILRLQRIPSSLRPPPARSPSDDANRSLPAPAECRKPELRCHPSSAASASESASIARCVAAYGVGLTLLPSALDTFTR